TGVGESSSDIPGPSRCCGSWWKENRPPWSRKWLRTLPGLYENISAERSLFPRSMREAHAPIPHSSVCPRSSVWGPDLLFPALCHSSAGRHRRWIQHSRAGRLYRLTLCTASVFQPSLRTRLLDSHHTDVGIFPDVAAAS